MEIKHEPWSWKNQNLLQYLQEGNTPNWSVFESLSSKLETISKTLEEEAKKVEIYPPINRVFRVFEMPKERINVVVIGQDPYHNEGSAVGLCFAVPKTSFEKLNPSLKNIYKELENEGFTPTKNGDLSSWEKQGVFLINTALTVEKGTPESHLAVWWDFTEQILLEIAKEDRKIAWLFMGAKALAFQHVVTNSKHEKFITSHPSPFSANSGFRTYPAFMNSNVFKKINKFLGKEISW